LGRRAEIAQPVPPHGKMLGFSRLILTTVGARSGAERTSPVCQDHQPWKGEIDVI